ncbi:MAG: type III pantothenate kinase [Bacteroidales bacterium]|nr:type III pantothenate kinase [Bacteroidales bacterium]
MDNRMVVIDQGNTLTKCALFLSNKLLDIRTFRKLTVKQLNLLFNEFELEDNKLSPVQNAIISSVSGKSNDLIESLNIRTNLIVLKSNTPLPITIKYKSPDTLGNDRIAAVVGASSLFKKTNLLIIDAGTCITYDMITDNGEYLGGGISPGINMRLKALNTFTGQLPLIELSEPFDLIGNSTKNSILSGVMNGFISEVNGIIDRYLEIFPGIKIILTGGETKYFDKYLKNNIFAVSNLVLSGLKDILRYNVEN